MLVFAGLFCKGFSRKGTKTQEDKTGERTTTTKIAKKAKEKRRIIAPKKEMDTSPAWQIPQYSDGSVSQ